MPAQTAQPTLLPPRQTRLINARGGFRLEVLGGGLWLTRPGDQVDRFLYAGAAIDLHQDRVLVQSDWNPANSPAQPALYRLTPLHQNVPQARGPRTRMVRRRGWFRLRPFSA